MVDTSFHTAVVLALLNKFNEQGLTPSQILEKTGWEAEEANSALQWLVKKGYACRIGTPDLYALTPDYVNTI